MAKNQSREFIGIVKDGKLSCGKEIAELIRRFEGKKLVVAIKEFKRRRSNPQNRYYWGVVVTMVTQMFQDVGNDCDEEDVHEFLKQHVGGLRHEIYMPGGYRALVVGSSARLNTLEFEVYLEKIRAWAAQFELVIPLPNEDLHAV